MKKALALAAVLLIGASCTSVSTTNTGLLYTDAKSSTMVAAGNASAKTGMACTKGIIGIVTGDSSIEAAMKKGGIRKVTYVDHTVKNILGIVTEYCTIVHGN